MPIYFVHETARVDIEDVPLDEYAKIQEATGLQWWEVASNPLRHAKAAELLANAAGRLAGVPVPDRLTPKQIVAMFDVRSDEQANVAEVFNEGIPDPKAEDAPATT
jgi:hypothetical protein